MNYKVKKNIRYKNPDKDHPRSGQLVLGSEGAVLPFPHLSEAEINLLIKTRTIEPVEEPAKKKGKGVTSD